MKESENPLVLAYKIHKVKQNQKDLPIVMQSEVRLAIRLINRLYRNLK